MKKILFTLLIFFICHSICNSQDGKPYKKLGKWLGNWRGTLEISNSSESDQSILMNLIIKETDSAGVWNWEIIYGDGLDKDERNYLLREIDFQKGLFILDEQNSIFLDFYYKDFSTFYSTFSVNGNLISSEYKLDGNKIYFKIVFSDMKPESISSDNSNDSTFVYSYPVKSIHYAELIKE